MLCRAVPFDHHHHLDVTSEPLLDAVDDDVKDDHDNDAFASQFQFNELLALVAFTLIVNLGGSLVVQSGANVCWTLVFCSLWSCLMASVAIIGLGFFPQSCIVSAGQEHQEHDPEEVTALQLNFGLCYLLGFNFVNLGGSLVIKIGADVSWVLAFCALWSCGSLAVLIVGLGFLRRCYVASTIEKGREHREQGLEEEVTLLLSNFWLSYILGVCIGAYSLQTVGISTAAQLFELCANQFLTTTLITMYARRRW